MSECEGLRYSILILILIIASFSDIKSRKINNRLVFIGLLLIAPVYFLYPFQAEMRVVSMEAAAMLLLLPLRKRRMIGGGDLKLMILIFCAFPGTGSAGIIYTGLLMAAVYGLLKMIRKGILIRRIGYICSIISSKAACAVKPYCPEEWNRKDISVPLAPFLLAGTLVSMVLWLKQTAY